MLWYFTSSQFNFLPGHLQLTPRLPGCGDGWQDAKGQALVKHIGRSISINVPLTSAWVPLGNNQFSTFTLRVISGHLWLFGIISGFWQVHKLMLVCNSSWVFVARICGKPCTHTHPPTYRPIHHPLTHNAHTPQYSTPLQPKCGVIVILIFLQFLRSFFWCRFPEICVSSQDSARKKIFWRQSSDGTDTWSTWIPGCWIVFCIIWAFFSLIVSNFGRFRQFLSIQPFMSVILYHRLPFLAFCSTFVF